MGSDSYLNYKIVSSGTYTVVQDWKNTSDILNSGCAVATWTGTQMDIFYVGSNYSMFQKTVMHGSASWDWAAPAVSLGEQTFGSTPSVSSWGYGRFDVFCKGNDGYIWTINYDLCNGGWSEWQQLGDFKPF
jgi:hypothetical protein